MNDGKPACDSLHRCRTVVGDDVVKDCRRLKAGSEGRGDVASERLDVLCGLDALPHSAYVENRLDFDCGDDGLGKETTNAATEIQLRIAATVKNDVDLVAWFAGLGVTVDNLAGAQGNSLAQMVLEKLTDKSLARSSFVQRMSRVGRDAGRGK